jgi:hypothetical protein
MKKLQSILLLTISLSFLESCQSPKLSMTGEQCSPVFVYTDETKKLIDADQSFCNVRQYEMSIYKVGSLPGTSAKKPIQYCDRCVGFKNYAEWATFWEEVRRSLDEESI